MRARLIGAVLLAVLLVPAPVALAAPGGGPEYLAVEGEPLGPEPRGADPDNPFAPERYQPPWTWGMGVGLFGLVLVLTGAMGLAYYLQVRRPEKEAGREQRSAGSQ